MGDFLKRDVKTPYCGCYLAAGIHLTIQTNSQSILGIAGDNFEPADANHDLSETVRLKLWVEDEPSTTRDAKPYFRGLGHLVFSGYDDRSSLLIDLRDLSGAGRVTQSLADNTRYWKTVLFPSLLAIIGPSVGLTSLHSACVAWKGQGLLLVGDSGAGKSSLSLALAQRGLDFVADDRTLVSEKHGKLTAWGLGGDMKQRAEASIHFPQLRNAKRGEQLWKENPVFRFDPAQVLGVTRTSSCEPRWILFLERQTAQAFQLEQLSPEEAAHRMQKDVHQELPEAAERQRLTIEALSRKSCYLLRYGGDPHTVAGALHEWLLGRDNMKGAISRCVEVTSVPGAGASSDPLRRFRATCLRSDVFLMGRHIRVETDSPVVQKRVVETFNSAQRSDGPPEFVWRIVSEPRQELSSWPSMTAFCQGSLRYINLGQFSFAAADLEAREAVGVLPESLCEDEIGFPTVFLASLLHLSAPALGLTPISAACVAKGGNGLLLFGPPNSGKTTASYWGRKLGLDFHSDQATFLELEGGAVHAWGDFWPAAFRPEAMEFLPELSSLGRSFTYKERTFLCVDRASLSAPNRGRVIPAACIFLERHAASPPRLVRLSRWEVPKQVFTEAGSQEDRKTILALLGRVPAYRLLYDDDPSMAARFFRSVLEAHQLMEQRV